MGVNRFVPPKYEKRLLFHVFASSHRKVGSDAIANIAFQLAASALLRVVARLFDQATSAQLRNLLRSGRHKANCVFMHGDISAPSEPYFLDARVLGRQRCRRHDHLRSAANAPQKKCRRKRVAFPPQENGNYCHRRRDSWFFRHRKIFGRFDFHFLDELRHVDACRSVCNFRGNDRHREAGSKRKGDSENRFCATVEKISQTFDGYHDCGHRHLGDGASVDDLSFMSFMMKRTNNKDLERIKYLLKKCTL